MNKPVEYSGSGSGLSMYTVTQCLAEYSDKIKFKEVGESAIDLGCADGSVTCLLKDHLPRNYDKFVACDVNENMLKYAREKHADKNIKFVLQNVEGTLADDLKGCFNHVFSFFLFHWIQKQEIAFRNVYDMLSEGGQCFHIFFTDVPVYHVFEAISLSSKWGTRLEGIAANFLSPYYKMKNPEKRVTEIMENAGFINVDVQVKKMRYPLKNLAQYKQLIRAVEPFDMPKEEFEDFFEDLLAVSKDIGVVDKTISKDDVQKEIVFNYTLIIATASKP